MKPSDSSDGIYRYRWTSRIGRHTVFIEVSGGVIQQNAASMSSPVKPFEGKRFAEFEAARLDLSWRWLGDDSLHQVTQAGAT